MDSSKFPLPPPQYHSKHDFSFLLNSALAQPELLEDFEKSSQGRTSGRWSKEEHHRFIEGLTKFGKNWKKVEEHIGTRTGAQIRSHAQKFFIRLTKEFKKRVDKDHSGSAVRTGDDYHMDEKKIANPQTSGNNRQRSNSVISNFSNFSLGSSFSKYTKKPHFLFRIPIIFIPLKKLFFLHFWLNYAEYFRDFYDFFIFIWFSL